MAWTFHSILFYIREYVMMLTQPWSHSVGEWGRFEKSIKFLREASDPTKPDNAATYRPKVTTSAPQSRSEGHSQQQKTWYKRSRNVWTNSDSCTWLIHLVNWWSSYFGLSSSMLLYNLIRIITQQPNLSTEIMSCNSRPHTNPFAQLKLSSFL